MRAAPLVLASMLLAGCSSPAPAGTDDAADEPQLTLPPLLIVAEGTYRWHEPSTQPTVANALVAYNIVTQTAVNPCDFQGHAYFNNRQIPAEAVNQRHRSGNLTVTFDWTDMDYPLQYVVLGYKAPGMGALAESPRIPRGQAVVLHIDADPHDGADAWTLYACLNRQGEDVGSPAWQPGPFVGSFTVRAEFQGDPELPEVAPENETRRTSRGGGSL